MLIARLKPFMSIWARGCDSIRVVCNEIRRYDVFDPFYCYKLGSLMISISCVASRSMCQANPSLTIPIFPVSHAVGAAPNVRTGHRLYI